MIGVTGCALAQLAPSDDDKPATTIRLIADRASIVPGSTVWIGLEFSMAPGWHIYWPGQNDSGYAPAIEWILPDGLTIGEIHWPVPHRHIVGDQILDHTFEGRIVALARLTASGSLTPERPVTIEAGVEWLECEEGCVPRDGRYSLSIPVASTPTKPGPDAPRIKEARAALPRDNMGQVLVSWRGLDRVRITPDLTSSDPSLSIGPAARVAFYPHESGIPIDTPIRNAEAKAPSLELPLDPGSKAPLRGIVECWDTDGRSLGAWSIDVPRGKNLPRIVGD